MGCEMGNEFLEGNYAPVSQEHTITELKVTGRIPEYLDGRYLRNGPNPLSEVDPDVYHWFMGGGMVHGVRLREGRAEWYRNRWVRTPDLSARLAGRPRIGGMDAIGANTNVIGHARKTIALVEGGPSVYELTDELDTVGACDFDGTLPGGYTAHPKRDPHTGELHAVSYFFGNGNKVQYSVIDTEGRARRTVDIEVTGSPMMHDFSLTEKHVVFYDLPVTFSVETAAARIPARMRTPAKLVMSAVIGKVRVPDPMTAMMTRQTRSNGGYPYRWNSKYPARIGVMPREGGNADVRWFEVEPCFVFHPLNAYDDGDHIVLDVVRHARMFDVNPNPGEAGGSTLDRWTVDLAAGKVIEERLDERGQEFPRVDERLVGLPHRYGYSMATAADGVSAGDSIYKHDFRTGSTAVRPFGAGHEPGEFVFVPSSADAGEDEGVLVGLVFDAASQRSDLTILDASTLDTVAAVHLPDRVAHGFHGNWVPTDS